jgi:hypothetical protein
MGFQSHASFTAATDAIRETGVASTPKGVLLKSSAGALAAA